MRVVSLGMLGVFIFCLGVACSDGDLEDDHDAAGGTGAGESGGAPGDGGGEASGGTTTAAGGAAASGGQDSELSEAFESIARQCEPGGYINAVLNLEDVEGGRDGLSLVVSSGEDSVEGGERNLFLESRTGYAFYFSWSSSAMNGTEVDATGVMLSTGEPEYNHCFTGQAMVGTQIDGALYHLVVSDDLTLANPDGSCTDTPAAGDVAFCVPDEF